MCRTHRTFIPCVLLLMSTGEMATSSADEIAFEKPAASNTVPPAESSGENSDRESRYAPRPLLATPRPRLFAREGLLKAYLPALALLESMRARREIAAALADWEAASAAIESLNAEEEHVAYLLNKRKHTGHEIAVAIEFQQPVCVDGLRRRFRWKQVRKVEAGIVLIAEPREAIETMFYRSCEVTLDRRTHLPVSLRFTRRDGNQTSEPLEIVTRAKPREDNGEVKLVSAESTPASTVKIKPRELAELKVNSTDEAVDPGAQQELSPELETLLKNWERAASKRRTLEAQFVRHVFNTVYRVEKVSEGRLYFENPDKGRLDFQRVDIKSRTSQKRDSRTGKAYKLRSKSPESWIWTGTEIVQHMDDEKQAWVSPSPTVNLDAMEIGLFNFGKILYLQGPQNLFQLVLNINVDNLKKNYHLQIIKRKNEEVWLSAKPFTKVLSSWLSEVTVILNTKTYQVRAARYIDPMGQLETVYTFGNWKVNVPVDQNNDPLYPDLTGYKINGNASLNHKLPVEAPRP